MADPLSTVAAVVSLVDVTIRACEGISSLVVGLKDAPNAAQHLRQNVQNAKSVLGSLKLYVSEYESSKLFTEQHQLLPEIVKKELLGIHADLDLLQKFLPSSGNQWKIGQSVKWVLREKKLDRVIRRLESRQMVLMTGLQTVAQRTGIKIYEDISNLWGDTQSHMTKTDRSLEKQSSISQQLDEAARTQSNSFTAQTNTLKEIQMLAEPIHDNHVRTITKLDELGSTLASMRMSEGYLHSTRTFQTPSTDVLRRLLRAELRRVVKPTVERYLDSYKSSHNAQLEGIHRNLDQIVLDLGRSQQEEATMKHNEGFQGSTKSIDEFDMQDDDSLPSGSTIGNIDLVAGAAGPGALNHKSVAGSWSQSWSQKWIFRWRIGVLVVTVSTSHLSPRFRRRTCQAFKTFEPLSERYSYRVKINFQPTPRLLITRGISVTCESRQDQRGYYEISPMISTFAIVPKDAEAIQCVERDDISGLRYLFEARLAAPTDRDANSFSLLHYALALGSSEICKFLLTEGADALATDQYGWSCMNVAQTYFLMESSTPASKRAPSCDCYSITRTLIRSGCDMYDAFENPYAIFRLITSYFLKLSLERPCWEDPPESLVEWSKFLCSQGFKFRDTLLMKYLLLPQIDSSDFEQNMHNGTITIFLLCMLKADVSFREATYGNQALHVLFLNKWSAELSPHFINIAYILIHFGGADVSALNHKGFSPTSYAYVSGWWDEWEVVLDRCGLDGNEVFQREYDLLRKQQRFGDGESSAVDTEELIAQDSSAVTRRRPVAGDRLDD